MSPHELEVLSGRHQSDWSGGAFFDTDPRKDQGEKRRGDSARKGAGRRAFGKQNLEGVSLKIHGKGSEDGEDRSAARTDVRPVSKKGCVLTKMKSLCGGSRMGRVHGRTERAKAVDPSAEGSSGKNLPQGFLAREKVRASPKSQVAAPECGSLISTYRMPPSPSDSFMIR